MSKPSDITPGQAKGRLVLIPSALGGDSAASVWPAGNLDHIRHIRTFIVENVRSARRFLRMAGFLADFGEVRFLLLNKHSEASDVSRFLDAAANGEDIGLLSEAGIPCIADPGQYVVGLAHRMDIKVVPLVGASSILLGLAASGFNGQEFAFHGYLPIRRNERQKKIRELERQTYASGQTQIFMETPFRNNALMGDLMLACRPQTLLCVACDLTLPNEYIRTQAVGQWEKAVPDLHKRTSIFLICRP